MSNKPYEALRQELLAEQKSLEAQIAELKRRRNVAACQAGWLQYDFRYGDIAVLTGRRQRGKRYVVVSPAVRWSRATKGRVLKKDGTLGKATHSLFSGEFEIVGPYQGDDLPEPDAAARFGLEHR